MYGRYTLPWALGDKLSLGREGPPDGKGKWGRGVYGRYTLPLPRAQIYLVEHA